jgi:hypothetical protein
MKQEFKLLKEIIRDYMPADYEYDPVAGDRKAKQADYDMVDVIPVSDPNSATMAQRIMQYQAIIQLAQGAPQIYNLPQLHRQMIEVLGVKNADKLVPIDDDMTPRDPISENMSFLTGKPTKAFIYQDHDAHIAVHTSMMQDPLVMGQMGQNPMAQQMQASIMAHVAEHVAFQYRSKIEQRLGATLPAPDTQMSEDIEVQLSKLVAQAAKQLLDINKNQAAQQQAQQQMQDPVVQMQQAELQIKQQVTAKTCIKRLIYLHLTSLFYWVALSYMNLRGLTGEAANAYILLTAILVITLQIIYAFNVNRIDRVSEIEVIEKQ